jgi:DsbC/DsbD-like thiol-disulfide interchange protein
LAAAFASASGSGAPTQSGGKKSDSVVKTTAEASRPDSQGQQILTVTMAIEPGWHIYANPVGSDDLESVQTTVGIGAKTKLEAVKVQYPEGKQIEDKVVGKYKVYEDKVEIKAIVKRKAGDDTALEVTAKFQACTDKMCLLPATVKMKVP